MGNEQKYRSTTSELILIKKFWYTLAAVSGSYTQTPSLLLRAFPVSQWVRMIKIGSTRWNILSVVRGCASDGQA